MNNPNVPQNRDPQNRDLIAQEETETLEEERRYQEWATYQDDPEREAGERFQDKLDMFRNEH